LFFFFFPVGSSSSSSSSLRSHHSGLGLAHSLSSLSSRASPTEPDCAVFLSLSLLYLASKRLYMIRAGSISSRRRWYFLYSVYFFLYYLFFSSLVYIFFFDFFFFPFRSFLDFQETERSRSLSLSSLYVYVVLDWRCQANNARLRRRSGAGISAWLRSLRSCTATLIQPAPHSILYRSFSLSMTWNECTATPAVHLSVCWSLPISRALPGITFTLDSPNHKVLLFFFLQFCFLLVFIAANFSSNSLLPQPVRPSEISIHHTIDRNSH